MFTGIIEEMGIIRSRNGGELVIECGVVLKDTKLGDSISVNGVDLTVRLMGVDSLTFDVMPETFRRSNLADLETGTMVNLERSLQASDRLSGHVVRGVVETVCTFESMATEGDAKILMYLTDPEHLSYIVMKGPVCVDGVSLTVMGRDEESFSVSLVQYTQEHTNLTRRQPGDRVNLETDIMARYIEQLLSDRSLI